MRISDIISLGKQYLFLGIIFAIVLTITFLLGYCIIYKKILKGEKRITRANLIWFIVFTCYLVVVFGATMLSRGNWNGNIKIPPLFYSYKEAWNSFEPRQWRNIILNILLFVPLGFLLPLGLKWFRKFWKTYFIGFLVTLGIETLQLLLNKGIFELDDLFNNTIGTMIGYGCFAIVTLIISLMKRKKKYLKRTIGLQLPLLAVIISFTILFASYGNQELGNLRVSYISEVNKDKFTVDSDIKYSTDKGKLAVYKTKRFTQEETRKMAEAFFSSVGETIDESRTDLYDDTAVYYSDGMYSVWIDYLGGIYRFIDYDTSFAEPAINIISDASEEDIRLALEQYEIELPDGMDYSYDEDGNYTFTAKEIKKGSIMYDGTLSCQYYQNGKMGSISGNILQCEFYKDFNVISEEDAYKMIEEGKFNTSSPDNKLSIETGQVVIQYIADSKGYYQPVYVFESHINGDSTEIYIPTIK